MVRTLEKLRRENKKEFVDLVKMHLSFLVELSTDEWENLCDPVDKEIEQAEKMKKVANSNKHNISQTKYFTSISSSASVASSSSAGTSGTNKIATKKFIAHKEKEVPTNIFGKPLTSESLNLAMLLIKYLREDDHYKLEGIFRKSGTHERQQDLRFMLDNRVHVDLRANRFTPIDTSCVLKDFIQHLPEPLLTNNHFELHLELARAMKKEIPPGELAAKSVKRLMIVQLLLHLLPELNRKLFFSVMGLLNKVARAIDVTRMNERSLATIFGQHILCPRTWTPKQVQQNIGLITDAMEFLLINYDALLSGPNVLLMDAKKKFEKKLVNPSGDPLSLNRQQSGEDSDDVQCEENNTVVTFCQRKDANDTTTAQSVAALYAHIQTLPNTPSKKKLIKQFNRQNGIGTPMNPEVKESKWKSLFGFMKPLKR